MKILVTGAHGLLGRSLLSRRSAAELIGCGRGADPVLGRPYHAVDILEPQAVRRLLEEVRPDWVIHTAALTNVDLCERQKELARRVNLESVAHLVEACTRVGASLAQLSTDYVFDGERGPYGEEDPPHPLSHYGALKLESERLVLEGEVEGLVLRTLWLYGYICGARPNLVTWPLRALARGEALRIVDDQWGNPTYVHDLAEVLLELCRRHITGLLHMGGSTYMTRCEVVLELARFFGLDTARVAPVSTAAAGQPAPRPLRSGLRSEALSLVLGRAPLSLREGLERMVCEEDFRRDFAYLERVR